MFAIRTFEMSVQETKYVRKWNYGESNNVEINGIIKYTMKYT